MKPSVQMMRLAIYDAYSGRKWGVQVDNMTDIEVGDLYIKFVRGSVIRPINPDDYCICGVCGETFENGVEYVCAHEKK